MIDIMVAHVFFSWTSSGSSRWKNWRLCTELGQEFHGSSRWRHNRRFWRVLHSGDKQDVPGWVMTTAWLSKWLNTVAVKFNHGCVFIYMHFHTDCVYACFSYIHLFFILKTCFVWNMINLGMDFGGYDIVGIKKDKAILP